MPRLRCYLCLSLLILPLAGCAAPRTLSDPQAIALLAAIPYPVASAYGEDLDILVERKTWRIQLTNRTATHFRNPQLWLNQQWVGYAEELPVGQATVIQLGRFINEHHEPFPMGGFLSPDKAAPMILAELVNPTTGLRHRLVVEPSRR